MAGDSTGARKLGWLCAVALLGACAHWPGAAPPSLSRPVDSEDVVVPAVAGAFRLHDSEHFDETARGLRYRYDSSELPGAWAELYLVPIDVSDGASLTHVLDLAQQRLDMEIEAEARDRQAIAGPVQLDSWTAPQGVLQSGIVGFRDLTTADQSIRSYTFLTVHQALYVEVRMRVPGSEVLMTEDPLEPFLEALSNDLEVEPPSPRKLVVNLGADLVRLGVEKHCDFNAWVAYGTAQLQAIEAGQYLDTFDRELEARQRALARRKQAASRPQVECGASSLQAAADAQESGLLREYVWWYYQRLHWRQPFDLDLDRFEHWASSRLPADHDPIYFPALQVVWEMD